MAERNQPLIHQVITALGDLVTDKEVAERVLKEHFKDHYILDAGNVNEVADFATALRLRISEQEQDDVLDYMAQKGMVGITIDIVEEAINELFPDRFIEPET